MRILLFLLLLNAIGFSANAQHFNLNKLSISDNGRFLVVNDGNKTPFFWLGDTCWQLFRLDRNDLDIYLETRAKQGFNVIQGPVLLSLDRDGNPYPNGDGYFPLQNMHDLNSLNSKYLEYYDYLLTKADSLGLYVCILPFWAQALNNYSINDLLAYGEKLGKYFGKYPNLIWCVGGEAAGESLPENVDALARGLKSGSQNNQLLCVHPSGFRSSSSGEYWVSETKKGNYNFQSSTWLDFNMIQSGHKFNAPNYQLIDIDYRLAPIKPTFESEYFYEDHAEWEHRNDPNPPRANATDVRKGAYWSVFAGGFGYTYGHHAVWQIYKPGVSASNSTPTVDWKTALNAEGATQMQHIKTLMLSFPYLNRIPDQSLLLSHSDTTVAGVVRVTRNGTMYKNDASYILAYIPSYQAVTISTKVIAAKKLNISWFNTRNGKKLPIKFEVKNTNTLNLQSPDDKMDYVLIIEDAKVK
jgi:hypothetical protein